MKVINLDETQYLESLRLSEYAFQYKVPECEFEKRFEKLRNHQIFGIREEDQLVSKLHLLSREVYVGSEIFKMGGIAGVASYPEYRRNGNVKELLIHTLEKMRTDGQIISMLHPFSVAFYRKYGWEVFCNRSKTTLQQSDLVMKESVKGRVIRYSKDAPIQKVDACYVKYAKQFSGMLIRDRDWWASVIDDLHTAIYYDYSQQPSGYILYSIKDSKMVVEEFVALNHEARNGLWNYICQHDSMVKEVEMTTYENEPLFFSLKNQTYKKEIYPYFMVRIVDVKPFLQSFEFDRSRLSGEVSLHITDPYAPWNERTYLIDKTGVVVEDKKEQLNGIHLNITALSTILFGHKRPIELYQIGLISGDVEDIQKLENLIPHRQGFFYDFF